MTDSLTERSAHSADEAWQQLEQFLRNRNYLKPRETINPDIDIRWKLGIDGDDAKNFIPVFFEFFKIKYGDFVYDKYFGDEVSNIFPILISILFAIFSKNFREEIRKNRESSKLTPKMLRRAIELGIWDSHQLSD